MARKTDDPGFGPDLTAKKNGGSRKGAAVSMSAACLDQKAQRAPSEATRAEPSAVPRRCEVTAAGVPA